ncbi:MAG: response regulator [Lachnospiraceae bacterium]|nr:response regulator [Lachnospiraceae bacterium]
MKHILMVDDNTTNLKTAAEVLQPFYQLSMAKSGRQALNFLKKNRPDLILLDIMMPEMNGYETMEQIKLNPGTANIPIIFLTADTGQESEMRGLKMGALDFITKPFEAEVMLSRIEKVLQMEDMRRNILGSASRDLLTDLLTEDSFGREAEHAMRESGGNASFIMLCIEGLKRLTEEQGSSNSNGVIIKTADAIRRLALNGSLTSRCGEDSFLLFVPQELSSDELERFLVELWIEAEREANIARSGDRELRICLAAFRGSQLRDYDSVRRRLDMAMYHVRRTEGMQYHIYRE